MAYNLKYRGTYKDSTGVVKEIRLLFEEYGGVVTELYTGETPAEYSMDLGDGVISGNPVGSTRFQFTLFFETLIDIREFMYTRRECLCEVYNRDTDKIEFQGWVEPYNGGRPNSKPPHIITLTASCGLAQLQKIRYKPDGGTRIRTLFDIIQDCLKLTGLQLPFVSNFLTRETAMTTTDPLKGVKLNTDRFIGNDKKMAYASEVLTSLLQVTNCEMFQTQHSGEAIWLLRSVPNQVRGYNHAYAYDKIGNYLYPTLIDNGFNINSTFANTLDVGAISALEAIQRHKVSVQLVGGVPGVIPNGDLLLWDGSTFAHWDMSTMAGNWNWFDTQDEFYPNGIQLNGSMGYSDLVEEYTTGWWIFKKKYTRAVEPARYIEVGPGDITGMENIALEGEYETSLNVEYVLMQIRMVKADDTTEMFWNAEINDWQDTVYYIALPAATAGRVESGVKKSRGKIEINLGITQSKYLVPFTKLYVRFYQVYRLNPKNPPSPPSGGYFLKLYGLWSKGSKQREITNYSVTLEVKDGVFENGEDEVIVLSGDFMTDVKGAFLREDGVTPTTSWTRRDIEETVSIYRTMLSDRLNMTWKMLRTYDGEIQEFSPIRITPQMLLTFLDTGITAKITRMTYDDRKRRLKSFSGVEVQWSEPDNGVTMYTEISYNSEDIRDGRTQGPRRPGSGEVYTDNDADGGQLVAPPDGSSGGERFRIGEEPGDNNYEDILQDWSFNHSLKFFTELPPLIFFHLQPGSREIDLAEYFVPQYWESDHNPDDFNLELFDAPAWVGTVTFNGLKVTVTGTPPEEAQYFVRAYIIDPDPEINIKSSVWIPITVLPYATAKFTLKDETNSPAGHLIPGKPNSYLYTNPWGVTAAVDGQHDAISWELRGGGGAVNINSGPTPVPVSGTVHNILTDVTYPAGIYDLVFRTYRDTAEGYLENYGAVVVFNLYDPAQPVDPEHTIDIELLDVTSTPSPLGAITPSVKMYKDIQFWDILAKLKGIRYDELRVTIFPEVSPFLKIFTPTITDITGAKSGNLISTSDGSATLTPGYESTDFLPVSEGDKLWYYGTTTDETGIAGYSSASAGDFVEGLLNSDGEGDMLHNGTEIIISSGITHIRASSNGTVLKIENVTESDYLLFDAQVEKATGEYSVFARAYWGGSQVYECFGQFVILEVDPEPPVAQKGIQLVKEGTQVEVLAELELAAILVELPSNFDFIFKGAGGVEYDEVRAEYYFATGNNLVAIPLQQYTGINPVKKYPLPVTSGIIQLFGSKTSLDIAQVHQAPSFHRVVFRCYLDDTEVAVVQGEVRFTPYAAPEDRSGLKGYVISSGVYSLIDESMPNTGGQYQFPILPDQFTVHAKTIDGTTPFDRVVLKLRKRVAGAWVQTYLFGAPDINTAYNPGSAITEVPGPTFCNLVGLVDSGTGKRYVFSDDGNLFIDEPGEYEVTAIFSLSGVDIASQVTQYQLVDIQDPVLPDPGDCCEGNVKFDRVQNLTEQQQLMGRTNLGIAEVVPLELEVAFDSPAEEWIWMHGLNKRPMVEVVVGGIEVGARVQYLDMDTLKVTFTKPQTGIIIVR